jgi:hypothetical protein
MARSNSRLRTLEDLRVLHSVLEPGLRDIYVEARSDRNLFRWYLNEARLFTPAVYAIDDRVQVDVTTVLEAGGEVGPRGRLIGLAAAVQSWALAYPAVTCIIDADRDYVFSGREYPDLYRTDYGSLEVYAFQPRPLAQLLSVVLGKDVDARDLIDYLTPALNELFLARAVLHIYGPAVPLVDNFVSCCECSADACKVDSEKLVVRSLEVASLVAMRGQVLARLEEARVRLPSDRRRAIRGHDIAPLLIKTLRLTNQWASTPAVDRDHSSCAAWRR